MRGVGKGIREFKDAKDHVTNEIEQGMKEGSTVKEEVIPAKA